jgi:cobalt/nickel transport system ATP-binding protein
MSAGVVVEGLGHRYPGADADALDDVGFAVEPGERVAVLGANGSGKTTLALHLNGILRPARGSVRIGELTLGDDTVREVRRRVGMVFQDPDDQLFMPSVGDDVAFGPANLGLTGEAREGRVVEALDGVGAAHLRDRTPHHLSGGEKRRVAIATALAMHPEVLVLDEPTSGLDPVGTRELAELIAGLPLTLVVVTHDLPFALATCTRAVILAAGRVVADGPTAQLLADTAGLAGHGLELPLGFVPQATRS